jgi:hydrogenase maturation protease
VSLVARVIALGRDMCGDDAVGPAILRYLSDQKPPPPVELFAAGDAQGALSLLETSRRVVIVDAVVGPALGEIVTMDAAALNGSRFRTTSTHGIDLGSVVALARLLYGREASPSIHLVGIGIAPVASWGAPLSAEVAAAVPRAAAILLRILHS